MSLSTSQSEFLSLAANAAVSSEAATLVPAELTLSQAIFESGWGKNAPGFNCFGIKSHTPRNPNSIQMLATHEWINGKLVEQKLPFQRYWSLEECFEDHGRLISEGFPYRPAWQKFMQFRRVDLLILEIGPIYATAPGYAETILNFAQSPTVRGALQSARQSQAGASS